MGVVTDSINLWAGGVRTTLALTILSFAAALPLGTALALARLSPALPLRLSGAAYVQLVRNAPLPVLFVVAFFGLPKAGVVAPPFQTAVAVLAVYTAAFVCEVMRAGVNTVPDGQADAARALGLDTGQMLRFVVLPQAARAVTAPLGNLAVTLVKHSSIAYTISVVEITGVADRINTETARPIAAYAAAAVAYLMLTIPLGLLVGRLERRLEMGP